MQGYCTGTRKFQTQAGQSHRAILVTCISATFAQYNLPVSFWYKFLEACVTAITVDGVKLCWRKSADNWSDNVSSVIRRWWRRPTYVGLRRCYVGAMTSAVPCRLTAGITPCEHEMWTWYISLADLYAFCFDLIYPAAWLSCQSRGDCLSYTPCPEKKQNPIVFSE